MDLLVSACPNSCKVIGHSIRLGLHKIEFKLENSGNGTVHSRTDVATALTIYTGDLPLVWTDCEQKACDMPCI